MACINPIYHPRKYKKSRGFRNSMPIRPWNVYADFHPCGMCLNCRKDKQNALVHRCEYELMKYKCGAFVTVTYDDYHIVDKLRTDSAGNIVATLSRDDCRHFLYRLNKNIKNHLPDNILSNHHFKYLSVGEYGGDGQLFDRPHFHFLFFGLDFAVCKKEFERSWQGQGMVKVLPILNGGIRYVLKYLDKQLFGDLAKQKYDDNNIERPYQVHSKGLGIGLYKEQLQYIKNHNGCYRFKGKDVPVPTYYKNKFLIKSISDNSKIVQSFYEINGYKTYNQYDLHDFSIHQAYIKECNMNEKLRLQGKPKNLFSYPEYLSKLHNQYSKDLAHAAYMAQVPL